MAPKAFIDQLPLATRYAHFYVDVRIHELLNVPVTTGDFCVVYKVKHAVHLSRRAPQGDDAVPSPQSDAGSSSSSVMASSASLDDAASAREGLRIDTRVQDEVVKRPWYMYSSPSSRSSSTHKLMTHQTPYEPIRAYKVKWNASIQTNIRIGIHRHLIRSREEEAGQLHSSFLLLTVYWRRPEDDDQRHRFGQIKINLAEYAPSTHGQRTELRQYLLGKCACNALLRLSIHMHRVDATHAYRVPRIQQGIHDPTSAHHDDVPSPPPASSSSNAPAAPDTDPNHGLEWHFKLPMPLLYNYMVIPPEHIEPGTRAPLFDDDILADLPDPSSGDEDNASTTSAKSHHPGSRARMRWKRIMESVAGARRAPTDRREALRSHARSEASRQGRPSSPSHRRTRAASDSDQHSPIPSS